MKVSVIIPVYNTEKYLRQCLDSLINQTLSDFEAICVDDGSTDSSAAILEEYSKKDTRFHVIRKANEGQGIARNLGLQKACGEYVMFLDSDDFIGHDLIKLAYEKGKADNADIVLFDGCRYDTRTGRQITMNHFLVKDLLPASTPFTREAVEHNLFQITAPGPVMRIYRKSLIDKYNISFAALRNSEDLVFTYTSLAAAETITFIDYVGYFYRIGLSDNTESTKISHPTDFISAYIILHDNIKMIGHERRLEDTWRRRFMSSFTYALDTIKGFPYLKKIYERMKESDVPSSLEPKGLNNDYINYVKFMKKMDNLSFCNESISPEVSIIIPVYNAGIDLTVCLDSLLVQSFKNYEVICVNDGSTDNSLELLRAYEALDKRIVVLSQPNSGAGAARNLAIASSRGEYLYFMDSDDYVEPMMLEKCVNKFKATGAQVVAFNSAFHDVSTGQITPQQYVLRTENVNGNLNDFSAKNCPDYILQVSNPAPWSKMVRKDFVSDKCLLYQNLPNTNDAYFNLCAMALADHIAVVPECLYYYRVGQSQNIQSKKDKAPTAFIEAYVAIVKKLRQEGRFELVEKSWCRDFMSSICFNLRTFRKFESHEKVFNALKSPEVKETGIWDHEDQYFSDIGQYKTVKSFIGNGILFNKSCENPLKTIKDNNNTDIKVSVIIPVYNTSAYVEECLSSICNQTLKEIEIICVDDGSTDWSLEVVRKVAENDNRIRVYSQSNAGQGAARNRALALARGTYVYFMDSDDLLEGDALETIAKKMDDQNLDLALFGGESFYEPGCGDNFISGENQYAYLNSYEECISGREMFARIIEANERKTSVCLQLVRRKVLLDKQILFQTDAFHEDELYTFKLFMNAGSCSVLNKKYFHRRIRGSSTMTSRKTLAHTLGYVNCLLGTTEGDFYKELTEKQMSAVNVFYDAMLYMARKCYSEMTEYERQWMYMYVPNSKRFLINTVLATKTTNSPTKATNSPTKSFNPNLQYDFDCMKNSKSFRIGRAITFIPRTARNAFKRFFAHFTR